MELGEQLVVPRDLADALAADPAAERLFDSLSYVVRRWFVDSVTCAERPEDRRARVERALGMLREAAAR
jgi:uncharacterized protein YdeI (YjbR/CyaY-like superfamily)